jgi:flagellar motor switch protein FliG
MAPQAQLQAVENDKAAMALLLVLSLEEEAVSRVLRFFDPEEMRLLHSLASRDIKPNPENVNGAYRAFLDDVHTPLLATGEGTAYIERLAQRSLGREESKTLFKGSEYARPFVDLEKRDAAEVANVLAGETPQVIAAILAELSPAYSSSVLASMERDVQVKVLARLATLDKIPGKTLDALYRAVEEQLSGLDGDDDGLSVDGMGRVASILQRMPIAETEELLTSIGEEDPGLAFSLRRAMFSFEDLINIQGRGIQALIKEISNDQLVLALKTASDVIKDKILSGVSRRAAEIILDDLMAMGPVKLSEVEKAQQEIVDTALRLESEGKIIVAGRGGEELV